MSIFDSFAHRLHVWIYYNFLEKHFPYWVKWYKNIIHHSENTSWLSGNIINIRRIRSILESRSISQWQCCVQCLLPSPRLASREPESPKDLDRSSSPHQKWGVPGPKASCPSLPRVGGSWKTAHRARCKNNTPPRDSRLRNVKRCLQLLIHHLSSCWNIIYLQV